MPLKADQARAGLRVTYRPYPGAPLEGGAIVRLSETGTGAFVLYDGDTHPKLTTLRDLDREGG